MDNLSKEEIELGMSSIQKKRNNIHLFTKEKICTLDEADKNIKTLCLIINELGSRISYRNYQIEQMHDDMAGNAYVRFLYSIVFVA